MNRNCYRVIFNKNLGHLVVVSEKTRSAGKSDNSSMGGSMPAASSPVGFGLKTLTLSLLFSLGMTAHAGTPTTITADPSADKSLQPIVLPTASGIVSVNIATPNDKGLSNNHYSQFDVSSTGAVLNNNRKAVNTQIAGYVQANPFMAKGEASTILNQINSNNPSHLGGFIEIAGQKADVIIANPSGLVVNGAGFINAGNVHLVAANGKFDQGQITGYQVNTGNIEVNGKLNLQNTDYAALIAKTAQINDEIYAGSVLDIVTGENTVTLQDGKFNQLSAAHKNDGASSTNQTGIALDVAALGGMYAGKIRLIGTDKGFGVNNQGMIAATGSGVQAGTGTLTLDHQGNLVNTGIVSAKDKLAVNTHNHSVQNDGTLLGEQSDIAIDTAKLTNTGTIASTQNTKITATNAIDNQGSMYGGVLQVSTDELTNTGKLVQTGTGKLTISTHTLTNTNKAAIGQSLYEKTQLKAPSVPSTDQSAGTVSHQPADNTTTNNSNNGANTPNPSTDTPSANGFISTTKSLNNTGDKALITATGDIGITANQTRNTHQASIDAQSFTTNTLANTDSKIALDDIHWQLTSFDNSKGDISAKDGMVIESGSTIINAEGSLTSGGDMVLVAKNEFNNSDGVTQSAGGASITASSIINNQGMIHSAHALTLSADGTLTNNDGVISGTQNTTVATKTAIDNADGRIQSHGKLSINTRQLNSTGTIYAAQDTAITASHINNEQAGLIASAKDVRIDTQSLTSAGTISAGMQSDGKLGNTPANISIQATEGIRNNGNAIATGTLTLNANTINLDDSKTQADNITLLAQDTISTRKTSTVASNSLAITAPNKLDNSEGILSANEMIVNTDVLDNRQGTISQAGKTALSLAIKRSIDNTLGTISTNSDKLKIDTNQLINQQGAIHHAGVGELHVKSENLNNNQGELLSLGTQTLNINKTIDNSQGVISATGFTINADGLDNTAGLLQATDKEADNSLNIDSTLDNNKLAREQGSIDVAGNLVLTAKALQNQGAITANNLKATVANVNNTGAIGVRGNIQIASSQDIDNTGNISAAGNITLNANNIISHQGVMMAADNITATANRLNFNQSTSSADNISLSAQADIHHNQGATVANNKLSLKNTSAIYNQGGVLSANHTSIDTKDLQNGGIIQADVLAIKQQADYTHTDNDKLLANNLQFSTDGKIINQSQLIANQDLTLGANHIDNTQTGTISSGNHTQITSQTSINNQGLINGETTVIKAKETINNQSGGRIYGTHLAIQADTLNNTPAKAEQSDGKYTAPVIAARQRLDIGVKTLNNNPNPDRAGKFNENFDSQALITSLGSLHIGGSLDDNHHATGKAQTVVNKGATIESGGGMVIDTKTLLNGNADFKKHKVEVIEESVRKQTLYRAHEQASTIPAAQKSTDTADLDKKPMAGLFDCPPDSDCIINYDNDSVIWTHFGIEPPKEPIPDIKAKDLLDEPELPEGEDAQSCTLAGADNQACTQYKEALAHYTKVMGPLLKWEEENSTAIEALQLAIREHNRQFAKSDSDLALNIYTTDEAYLGPTSKKGAPEGALYVRDINGIGRFATEEVDVITTDFVVYEDKTLASDPARMVAGANLVVYGDTLINDKSQMSAGAGFLVVGDTVVQTPDNGLYGEKVKQTENGYFTRYTVESSAGGRRHKRVPTNSGAFVQEFAPLDAYQLPILNATINTIPVSTKHPPDALSSNDNQALLDALQANQANLSATAQAKLTALLSVKQSGQDVDEAVLASLVNELEHSIANNQAVVVTKTDNTINLPNSSLYTINADNPNLPVVQTDPAFTNYKQWLGSDYMLKAIQSDPNHIHKRLSDGYGEQARIKDEYYLLTGRHINTDYHSNEEAFKQLMDNGITAAKQFGYTLGTALTPDQMANLTSDIVWLVKQSITYTTKDKDGNSITKTEDVLVPKLYLRSANIATGTLSPDGRYSAVSARNINMQLTGDLDNNGNLIAKDTAAITANNVNNTGVINGDFVKISTNNDLINHGTLHANSAMGLDAKNRIMSQSLTTTQTNTQGRSSSSRTDLSQIATISVGEGLKDKTDDNGKPLTTLSLRGNQIIYQGATSDNAGGNTQMTAKNGIDITTITTSNHISAVADDNNYFKYSQTTDVGSNITSYGDTIIRTTGKNADINIKGSHLNATGTTALIATGDISITEGRATQSLDTASKFTDKGILSKKTTQTTHQMDSNTSIQSTVGGENILIKSGGDMQIVATNVLANKDILLTSGGNMTIASATNTQSMHEYSQVDKKGLFATSPTSVTLGKQQTRQNDAYEQVTYTGSLVGTTGGNIRLEAGDDINIINSDIIAQKDVIDANTGNILFKAQAVDITTQNIQTSNESHFLQKTTGVTASVSSSLVGEVQSLETLKESVNDTNSRRAKLMGSLAAVSKARTIAQNLQDGKLGSIRAQATIGSQSTKSDSQSHQETNDAANIHADGNLIFDVSGKGADSTLTITGSNITAQENLYNRVEGDVLYQASTQTDTQDSQNSSKGAGFGVYASANLGTDGLSSNSAGFTINANKAKGSSSETTTTHTNTQVTVGGTTVNDIGGSLILDGANLNTNHLTGTIGKDLIVKSRQDEYQYTHDQKQTGFSADVGFNGKPQSFSINGGKTDIDASYKQVTHQSGIKAKESTLSVQGQGSFTGGYLITDAGKNQTQFAQGIQTQDIQNHLNYEGDAISVGIGIGADTSNPNGKAKPALQGLGYGTIDPVNKTSTTHSAITDQAGLDHINTESFNQQEVQNQLNEIITNEFNKEQALKELGAQVTITQAFDAERRAIRSEFAQKAEDYRKEAKDLPDNDPRKAELETKAKQIDDNLRLFDGITSALYAPNSNGIIGDVARAASPQVAYRIGQYFKENELKNQSDGGNRPEEQSPQHLLAHAVLGAAVSYATGNDITSGALAGASSEYTAPILASYLYGKDTKELTQEQKDTVTSVITLASTATTYGTTGDVSSAVSASEVGKAGVENNNWGGENWAYAVGGGKEYAQSQASLADYCANQSGNIQNCINNLQYTQGRFNAFQSLATTISDVHNYYNDMTIVSLSGGMAGYTAIVNNKSGEVWVSNYSDIGITLSPKSIQELENAIKVNPSGKISKSVGFGMSINFGSIKGGKMTARDVNDAIQGTSLGIQACKGVCVGGIRTAGKDAKTIYTYGVGTPQFGLTGGKMVKTNIVLTKENIDELLKIK